EHEILFVDVPRSASAASPAGDQRNIVACERALAEHRARIGGATSEPQRFLRVPCHDSLHAVTMSWVELAIDERGRAEEQFVLEPHVIDAGLQAESPVAKAHAALHVVRGLGLETEIGRRSKRSHADALIHRRQPEAARRAPEYGEHVVETMLQTGIQ